MLPSLGEEGVQTCTVRDLVPEGAAALPEADLDVARLKSSADMVTAIEAADGKVAGTVEVDGALEFAAADGTGNVFVNLEDKGTVVKFDGKALKALETWPLPMFGALLPRHLEIVLEINARFLKEVRERCPDDEAMAARVSLVD